MKPNKRSTLIKPDTGARRSVRTAARLERAIKLVEAELLKRDRVPWAKAPAISDMLKTLEALARLERVHLKLSVDPRPFIILKQGYVIRFAAYRDSWDPGHRTGTPLVLAGRNPDSKWTDDEAQQAGLATARRWEKVLMRRQQQTLDAEDDYGDDGRGTGEDRLEEITDP